MSITRINEFQAKAGQGARVRDLLNSFVPMIQSSNGCRSCQVLQNTADPARILVLEVWDSIEAHQASTKKIPVHAFEQLMKLLASSPKGEYYHS